MPRLQLILETIIIWAISLEVSSVPIAVVSKVANVNHSDQIPNGYIARGNRKFYKGNNSMSYYALRPDAECGVHFACFTKRNVQLSAYTHIPPLNAIFAYLARLRGRAIATETI